MTIHSENSGPLFAVNLLFRSSRDGVFDDANLWEESLVLIEALSADDAEAKAALLAVSAESSYIAMDGTHVAWTFFKVERVSQIVDQPLRHGSELFSRYLRHAEVQSLLRPFDDPSTQK